MDYGDINGLGSLAPLPDDFNISGQTQGDILYFDGSNWVRLASVSSGQVLTAQGVGSDPAYAAIPDPDDLNITSQATGDIIYYNGANWVRLAAGTATYLLTANGAAAPTWTAPAGGGDGLSNVIFCWAGIELQSTTYGIRVATTSPVGAGSTGSLLLVTSSTGYQTFLNFKFKKISSISTVTIQSRIYSTAGEAYVPTIQVNIGGQTNTVTRSSATPGWATSSNITVSGLSNGTTYDGIVQFKSGTSNGAVLCSAVTLIAS